MQHITDEALEKYAMLSLPPQEIEEVEEHLLACEECQERLEDAAEFVRSMSAAALVVRHMESPSRVRTAGGS